MFTATTFQIIRKRCLPEFESLLDRLAISVDWSGDEFRTYDKLDVELTEKICGLMKSPTIIDGYMNLLDLGGVAYNYSELDNELLGKVVDNKEKILDAVRAIINKHNSWEEKRNKIATVPKESYGFQIEVDTAKPFKKEELTSAFENIKRAIINATKRISGASDRAAKRTDNYHINTNGVEQCIYEANKLTDLLKLDGQNVPVDIKSVVDLIQKVAEQTSVGEEKILCLKITKRVEYREEEPPSELQEPPKSEFNVYEAEDALDVLTQLNEIISLAR